MSNRLRTLSNATTTTAGDRNRSDSIQSFVSSIFSVSTTTLSGPDEEEYISPSPSPSPPSSKQPSPLSKSVSSHTEVKSSENNIDFLQYIDPIPASPPNYNDIIINTNTSSRVYPIWEDHTILLTPPEYVPAVEDFTIIQMRTEFDSPTGPLPQFKTKIWQNFILEINSTQINLYHIHPKLTKHIPNYSSGIIPTSILSSFKKRQAYQLDKHDQTMILDLIRNNPKEYLSSKYLHESFSLQFSKCGLPLDFLYRNFIQNLTTDEERAKFTLNCVPSDKVIINLIKSDKQNFLRIRLEGKQFLWKFQDVETMLKWYQNINTGSNVALDLNLREFPNYRIVPRRRSNQYRNYHQSTSFSVSSSSSGEEEASEQETTDDDDDDDGSLEEEEGESLEEGDDEKYNPLHSPPDYDRFLNQSIRCIKPFYEFKTWQNRIIVMYTNSPDYTTINLPIYYHPEYIHSNNDQFQIKNHSLGLFLLNETNSIIKLDYEMVQSWNDVNNTRII